MHEPTSSSPRRRIVRLAATAAIVASAAGAGAAQAAPRPVDGLAEATAAASCWEIKQAFPASVDGNYWLMTPQLKRPEQFYCDMTTDGGGWVLVGRGRDGWRSEYEGKGTVAEVRANVIGQTAFSPRQLPGPVIDALLGGGRVDQLADGIRLRRATNAAGTAWQEVRFNLQGRDRWVWAFRARHFTRATTFNGVAASDNQRSNNFGIDSAWQRVNTDITSAQAWSGGFAFGSQVTGTPAPDSYMWSATAGGGFARPFTQVYLRPRLLTDTLSYPAIPDAGAPKSERVPLHRSQALPTVWGVKGLASNNGQDSELRSEVQAFAQVGDWMYVGGNFRWVQRDAAGTGQVEQPYLAAFNVHTGEWRSDFRPVLNNQVKDLVALPNGLLAVGGEFTTVGGASHVGLVLLDPDTGLPAPGKGILVENRIAGATVLVRSLKVQGNWLYLGGSFTHTTGWGGRYASWARNAARIDWQTGAPDAGWNPNFNGTVNEITPSADGSRVYAAGYFTASHGTTVRKLAALSAAPGAALIPWTPTFSVPATQNNSFQFTIKESAGSVWAGGSEHSFFSYDRTTLALTSGSISNAGGDFQAAVIDGEVAYAGCHCDDYIFSGTTSYPWPTNFAQADKLGFVGAWDATTGAIHPEFAPILTARRGYGAWALAVDSLGNLWMGGSFETSVNENGAVQFSGGFIRFAPRDRTAPNAPSNLQLTAAGGRLNLTWTGSAEANLIYEILADDRVVATSATTSATIAAPTAATRYFVRAADRTGNRSATSGVRAYDPGAALVETTVVARTAGWRWRYSAAAVSGWSAPSYDDGGWGLGAAPLGFGTPAQLGTDISVGVPSPRPLTAQFRTTFRIADPGALDEVKLTFIADDGVIVYLNGQEIGRRNLPAGAITQTTYATAAPGRASAEANLMTVTLPASALVAGTNVLAAQTHLNYRSTPDTTFHLTAKTYG